MSDTIIVLHATDLPGIAAEIRSYELLRTLAAVQTNQGKNYAIYDDPTFTPGTDLAILPFPSVGPTGSDTVCNGSLTIAGQIVKVTVYRLA